VKGRKHLYEPPNGAGLTPETWAEGADNSQHIDTRGKVDLRRMIEAAMNEPSAGGSTGAPADLSELNKVGLSGNVQLGKGVLGKGKNFIELAGSAGDNNSFTITSTRIGQSLTLTAPILSATRGNFEFDKKPGTTGAIQFTNFSVQISNLGSPTLVFDVTIRADDGTISDVQFGDVGILNADGAGLRALPAPNK
jgi:hypothetical protein